jgi:hypothetical protein
MNNHTPKWAPILGVGVPENDCRGQNTSHWGIFYIIKKLLKCKCVKCARMTHLDIRNTSYAKKKGRESNWQFQIWFPTTKSQESTRPPCVQVVCNTLWKALDKSYNFALDLILIKGLSVELWLHKVMGVPTLVVLGLSFGSPKTKSHLDVGLTKRCKVYYMGEGDGFPRVQVVVSFVSPGSFVACPSTKGVPTLY